MKISCEFFLSLPHVCNMYPTSPFPLDLIALMVMLKCTAYVAFTSRSSLSCTLSPASCAEPYSPISIIHVILVLR